MNRKHLLILTLAFSFLSFSAEAKSKAAPHVSTKSSALGQKVLWDAWYTVKADETVPYAFYNEKVEITDGRAHLQLRVWKKEEGFINEENMGAFATDTPNLTPLFYNYKGTFKATETQIDGTFDQNYLSIKIRKTGQDLPAVKKQIPKDTILSYMFPLWLAKKLPSLKLDQPVSFYAIAEDSLEGDFPVTTGTVTWVKPDEVATKTGTKRVKVTFMDANSFWWVKPIGAAIAIHTPLRKTLVQAVPREKAMEFLK